MIKFEQKIGRCYTAEEKRLRAIERHIYGMGTKVNDEDYCNGYEAAIVGEPSVYDFLEHENYSGALGWIHRYFEEVEDDEAGEEND